MILYRCYYLCPTPVYNNSTDTREAKCACSLNATDLFPGASGRFFLVSRPVLGADSEVILADGKTVIVSKPTVCPPSVWWDSEEISRDTWRILPHIEEERTPRSTYRGVKVTGGFLAAVLQYRMKILILHYGCCDVCWYVGHFGPDWNIHSLRVSRQMFISLQSNSCKQHKAKMSFVCKQHCKWLN